MSSGFPAQPCIGGCAISGLSGVNSSWEARYRAEHGIEALRALWAAKSRAKEERYRARHGTAALRAKWAAKARAQTRTRAQTRPRAISPHLVACKGCGAPFERVRYTWGYCDSCRHKPCEFCRTPFLRNGRISRARYCSRSCAARARFGSPADPRIGTACRIRVTDCAVCGRLFTQHGAPKTYCSSDCRQARSRAWQLEHQRRTHYTAIRYWTVAPTPEALELASTYFELRQELRRRRNGDYIPARGQ